MGSHDAPHPVPHIRPLLEPPRLWSRADVLGADCPVPRAPGVYAWWFRDLPGVPTAQARWKDGCALLYVGIAPRKPSSIGPPSRETLRSRIRYHYRGNAEGSTLRRGLGCLLGLELRRVGSGRRFTFAAQEGTLSLWMAGHAFVSWLPCERPWELETALVHRVYLPLNLDQNRGQDFHALLSELQANARVRARELPVLP